jgi:hypothetical protein
MENTPKSSVLTLVFRNWSAVVAKFRFERLSGVGVWLVNPSIRECRTLEMAIATINHSYPILMKQTSNDVTGTANEQRSNLFSPNAHET